MKIARWLPGCLLPWNLAFAVTAVLWWRFVIPDVEVLKSLAWGWVLRLYAVNAAAVLLFYGALELRLYWLRGQGTRFKYNAKFPGDQTSDVFWFGSQNIDNALRNFGWGWGRGPWSRQECSGPMPMAMRPGWAFRRTPGRWRWSPSSCR